MAIVPFWVGACLETLRVAIPMVDASAGGRTSSSIPPHGGTVTLHGDEGEARHSDSHGVLYYMSESPRRR